MNNSLVYYSQVFWAINDFSTLSSSSTNCVNLYDFFPRRSFILNGRDVASSSSPPGHAQVQQRDVLLRPVRVRLPEPSGHGRPRDGRLVGHGLVEEQRSRDVVVGHRVQARDGLPRQFPRGLDLLVDPLVVEHDVERQFVRPRVLAPQHRGDVSQVAGPFGRFRREPVFLVRFGFFDLGSAG